MLHPASITAPSLLLITLLTLSACTQKEQVTNQTDKPLAAIASNTQLSKPQQSPTAIPTITDNSPISKPKTLQAVPPNGVAQLDALGLNYFQGMGPLEYAVRLTGIPNTPTWRIRLRLYAENVGIPDRLNYRVKVDHYNLSPALYRDLVSTYGEKNTDQSLNNNIPHQHMQMVFYPVIDVAAQLDDTSVQRSQSAVSQNPRDCGLGFGCADLFNDAADSQWTKEQTLNLVRAPWEQEPNVVYAIVRGLAEQAGKLQLNGNEMVWTDGEIPEGLGQDRPWIEVLIDNYAGNGGDYQAHLIKYAADDSIRASVFRMYADGDSKEGNAIASQSYLCSRGNVAGKLRTICP